MSFIVVIPARYASTRLPRKALLDIAGKPMIAHTVACAKKSNASRVIVATDDKRIEDALADIDCEVCLTKEEHESGSDRLAEVVDKLQIADGEIVVNVQGDEPMIPAKLIDQTAVALINHPMAVMSTAAHLIIEPTDINNPNVVKVVFNQQGKALYFSRSVIPYDRDQIGATYWRHIGFYAYRAEFLKRYDQLKPSNLEQIEKLEQLRVLDNGESIMVETIDYDSGVGVDTAEDLQRVRDLFNATE